MYSIGKYEDGHKREGSVITNTGQVGKKPSIWTSLLEMVDHGS